MAHPIERVARLRVAQPVAGQVRDDRDRRRVEADATQERLEAAQDRLQHARMRGDVDRDARGLDALIAQPLRESLEIPVAAGDDAELGRVDRGEIELRRQQAGQGGGRDRDAQHAAGLDRVEQFAAQAHEPHRVAQAQNAGDAGGGVLAHRMADQRNRRNTLPNPVACHRDLYGEDRRKLQRGAQKDARGFGRIETAVHPDAPRLGGRIGRQRRQRLVDIGAETRILTVEHAGHAGMLGSAAGKEEDGALRRLDGGMGEGAPRLGIAQQRHRLFTPARGDDTAMLERFASGMERECRVGQ